VPNSGVAGKLFSVFGKPKRDVLTTTLLGLAANGVSIRGHVYSPMPQNEKRTTARLLSAGGITSRGHRAEAACSGVAGKT
jgi:hypothetical protein